MENYGSKSKFYKKYIIKDKLVYYVTKEEEIRLEVPKSLQTTFIKEVHEGIAGRHIGRDKTLDQLKQRFFWKGMTTDTYNYVDACIPCSERNLRVEPSPLQDTPIASYPFQRIGVDTTGAYPLTANENKFCVTVTDHYSGWVEIIPIPNKKASTICDVLLNQVFCRYGFPRYMTSDNGTEWVNELLGRLTALGHIHHIKTSVYHPRGNLAERPHRIIHDMMAKISTRDDWDEYVPSIRASINFSKSASRGYSPFYLLFHRESHIPLDTLLKENEDYEEEDDFLQTALKRMNVSQGMVKKRLQESKERNRNYYNSKYNARHRDLKVGDAVFMFNFNRKDKFDARWLSGYHIIKQTGPVSFVVQHDVTHRTHRVHVDALRYAKGTERTQDKSPDKETSLEPTESSTDGESDSLDDSRSDVSTDTDSDATILYDYEPPKRSSRTAKEAAKFKMKQCQNVSKSHGAEHSLAELFHMVAEKLNK